MGKNEKWNVGYPSICLLVDGVDDWWRALKSNSWKMAKTEKQIAVYRWGRWRMGYSLYVTRTLECILYEFVRRRFVSWTVHIVRVANLIIARNESSAVSVLNGKLIAVNFNISLAVRHRLAHSNGDEKHKQKANVLIDGIDFATDIACVRTSTYLFDRSEHAQL